MGALGALLAGAASKRRLTLDLLRQAMDSTAKLSSFVIFILIGARVFSLTFYGVNGHLWVEHLLISLPGGADRLPDRRQRLSSSSWPSSSISSSWPSSSCRCSGRRRRSSAST